MFALAPSSENAWHGSALLIGIQPDIPASPTIAGVIATRDEVLERTLAYVHTRAGTTASGIRIFGEISEAGSFRSLASARDAAAASVNAA